ncbi:MAG TPA: hypothetical protein DEP19_00710 [Anaerolineae bacterium]|nr:hypothetical protein [Anaerolineae bacterium]
MYKSFDNLVIQDFREKPIWKPVDDFEDPEMLVEPFPDVVLNMEEIYLVSVKVTLADKSNYDGYIRISSGKPMFVHLSVNESEFASFPLQRSSLTEQVFGKEVVRLTFLRGINKKEDDVFPFTYQLNVEIRFEGTVY